MHFKPGWIFNVLQYLGFFKKHLRTLGAQEGSGLKLKLEPSRYLAYMWREEKGVPENIKHADFFTFYMCPLINYLTLS